VDPRRYTDAELAAMRKLMWDYVFGWFRQCGFDPHRPPLNLYAWNLARLLYERNVDPSLVDPRAHCRGTARETYEALRQAVESLAAGRGVTARDVESLVAMAERALEEWKRGNRSEDVIATLNESIEALYALGEARLASSLLERARRAGAPVRVEIPERALARRSPGARRRAAVRARARAEMARAALGAGDVETAGRAIGEIRITIRELRGPDAAAAELAARVLLCHWAEALKGLAGVPARLLVDTQTLNLAVDVPREHAERVLERLAPLLSGYNIARLPSPASPVVRVELDAARSEQWARLVEAMRYLLAAAEGYGIPWSEVLGWLADRDVCVPLAVSPRPETVDRLLAVHPPPSLRPELQPPPAREEAARRRRDVMERLAEMGMQALAALTLGFTVDTHARMCHVTRIEMCFEDVREVLARAGLADMAEECMRACLAEMLGMMEMWGLVSREEADTLAMNLGYRRPEAVRSICELVKKHFEEWRKKFGVRGPPPYCG
jgi:hypothetical protein